jgi:hypothetical protein
VIPSHSLSLSLSLSPFVSLTLSLTLHSLVCHRGILIVVTDDVQWTYELNGSYPDHIEHLQNSLKNKQKHNYMGK